MNPNVMHQMYQERFPKRFVSKRLAVQLVAAGAGAGAEGRALEAAEGQSREICDWLASPGGGGGAARGDLSVTGWRALAAAEGQPGEICGFHSVRNISYGNCDN